MPIAPPPNIREETVDAYAHCNDPRCGGYGQQPVQGTLTVVEHTIASRGGDSIFANLVENTNEYLRFQDPADILCGSCGKDRMITRQERPVIPMITGFPQDGLLGGLKFDANITNSPADQKHAEEMAEMRKEMAAMRALIADKGGTDAVG